MADNYEDILNQSWDNIQEVKVLPVGSYLLRTRNASFQASKDPDKSSAVLFVYEPKEPMDDVIAEELSALGDGYDISENRIFHRMYVETQADWDAVRQHLIKLGVEVEGKSIADSLKAAKGTEVIAFLNQRQFTTAGGEQKVDNNPQQFAKVE